MTDYLNATEVPDATKLTEFLHKLTELSAAYGLAINDGAELYEMEPEDRQYAYITDADSKLSRS